MQVLRAVVDAVSVTPNPVAANTAYLIAVTVSEVLVELEAILIYSGTFNCGEEGDIG